MTNLHTHLPYEDVKKSEKLQKIECRDQHKMVNGYWYGEYYSTESVEWMDGVLREIYLLPAPSIADILNAAEELFGYDIYQNTPQDVALKIFEMCLQDKSIEEISSYILDNIKK